MKYESETKINPHQISEQKIYETKVNPPKIYVILKYFILPLKFACTYFFGSLVGKAILPANWRNNHKDARTERNDFMLLKDTFLRVTKNRLFIPNGSNGKLDTVEIAPLNSNKKVLIHVINFGGNCNLYEYNLSEMAKHSKANNVVNIGFNYPGVLDSTGYAGSKDDLVNAGITQVQRLLDNGIPAGKIVLYGHSLGGAVATLVTKHFHDLGQKINLFNDRSFDTTGDFISGIIKDASERHGAVIKCLLKPLELLARFFIKPLVYITGWEMNAGDAYNSLPEENKDYLCVRPSKVDRLNGIIGDGIIPNSDSIHSAQKALRHFRKDLLDKAIKLKDEGKNDELEKLMGEIAKNFKGTKFEDISKNSKNLKKLRQRVKYDHKLYDGNHNTPLYKLSQRNYERSGEFLYNNFLSRVVKNSRNLPSQSIQQPPTHTL